MLCLVQGWLQALVCAPTPGPCSHSPVPLPATHAGAGWLPSSQSGLTPADRLGGLGKTNGPWTAAGHSAALDSCGVAAA